VLFGKCVAELLSTTMQGDNQLFHIFPYVAVICMVVTVASQLHFLAIALNYFDALYAVPGQATRITHRTTISMYFLVRRCCRQLTW
jgi:hypothetical protein